MKTPEMTLAEVLGQVQSKTKIAEALNEMSSMELADVLRAEGFGKRETAPKAKVASITKLSAAEKVAMADQWGRELAREFMKIAAEAKKSNKPKNDHERANKWGITGAALLGGLTNTARHSPGAAIARVAHNSLAGYGAGRLAHRFAHGPAKGEKLKKSSVIKVAVPNMAAVMAGAKQLASKAAPMVGKATSAVMGSSTGRRAAIGAGIGAVGGALKDPGMSSTGQPKSRLGGMIGGAALGGAAGAAAKPALSALGGMKGGVRAAAPKMLSPGMAAAPKMLQRVG